MEPEFVFEGEKISDQVKQIFTDATGLPMVGLMQASPRELLTFHQQGKQKQLIEMTWVVQSVREVVGAKTLEPIEQAPDTQEPAPPSPVQRREPS